MTPDHTVVLINGKRRHSISFPRPLDTALQGTTGVDLRAIPLAAIERIEVLRHGAVSQYGADAVGGVINIVLKENAGQSTASLEAGVTGEGDGERYGASANFGLPLGSQGSLNLALELFDQARTDRAFETSHLDPGGPNAPSIQRKVVLGEPEYDFKALFFNAAVPLMDDAAELYAFGGWSVRNGLSSGAWRDPTWAVPRLVGPVYPDGFLPFEESTSEDLAATAGLRSDFYNWNYDLGLSYGANTLILAPSTASTPRGQPAGCNCSRILRPSRPLTSSPIRAQGRGIAAVPNWKHGHLTSKRLVSSSLAHSPSMLPSAPATAMNGSAFEPATTPPMDVVCRTTPAMFRHHPSGSTAMEM